MSIRNAARAAFMNADSEAKVRRAFHARSRVASVPLAPGDLAYMWRKVKGGTCHPWHGPGHVLGTEGSRVWVASGSKVYRCPREQVKRPSEEQEALIRLLPENLRIMRSTIAERGAGKIVNLEGGNLPPDDERDEVMTEAAEPSDGEARSVVRSFDQVDHGMDMFDNLAPVAQRARTDVGPVGMGVDLGMGNEGQIEGNNELEYSPQTPARDDELEPQDLDLDHDHERQVTQVEPHAEPHVLPVVGNTSAHEYGPIRSPSRLTHAMRQNLDFLDHGRPVRTLERNVHDASLVEDELVHEEVYVVHVKKKGRKEVLETELGNHVKGKVSKAKRKEWDKMIASAGNSAGSAALSYRGISFANGINGLASAAYWRRSCWTWIPQPPHHGMLSGSDNWKKPCSSQKRSEFVIAFSTKYWIPSRGTSSCMRRHMSAPTNFRQRRSSTSATSPRPTCIWPGGSGMSILRNMVFWRRDATLPSTSAESTSIVSPQAAASRSSWRRKRWSCNISLWFLRSAIKSLNPWLCLILFWYNGIYIYIYMYIYIYVYIYMYI